MPRGCELKLIFSVSVCDILLKIKLPNALYTLISLLLSNQEIENSLVKGFG